MEARRLLFSVLSWGMVSALFSDDWAEARSTASLPLSQCNEPRADGVLSRNPKPLRMPCDKLRDRVEDPAHHCASIMPEAPRPRHDHDEQGQGPTL